MTIHTLVSPSLSEALTGCTVGIFSSHPETTGKNDFFVEPHHSQDNCTRTRVNCPPGPLFSKSTATHKVIHLFSLWTSHNNRMVNNRSLCSLAFLS